MNRLTQTIRIRLANQYKNMMEGAVDMRTEKQEDSLYVNEEKIGKRSENAFVKQIFDKETGKALQCRLFLEPVEHQSFGIDFRSTKRIEYEIVMKAAVEALRLEKCKAIDALTWIETDAGIAERERRKEVFAKQARVLFSEMSQMESGSEEFLDKERDFSKLMEQVEALELAFSRKNPWIHLYSNMIIPEFLTKPQVRKWIGRVLVENMETVEVIFPDSYVQWREQILDSGKFL